MRYLGVSGADSDPGTVPLNQIYCSPELMEACKLIRTGYHRPLEYAASLAFTEVSGQVNRKRKKHRKIIDALIAEMWLRDMLVDWLREEQGWAVDCPVISQHRYGNGELRKLKWASRVGVASSDGEAEIDCLQKYDDRWIIGEAKSGTNSYANEVVNRRIHRLGEVVEDRPCFVLGVPRDHQIFRNGTDKYIEVMGGRILVFDATSHEIHEKAIELYREWNPSFDDRASMSVHRNHSNELTGMRRDNAPQCRY